MYLVKYTRQYQADSLQGSICYDEVYVEYTDHSDAREHYERALEADNIVAVALYHCERMC